MVVTIWWLTDRAAIAPADLLPTLPNMKFSAPPPFVTHPLVRRAHAQTSIPYWLQKKGGEYRATQHAIPVGEGDYVILHDDCPITWRAGQRVVVLVHGLGGCHSSGYMVRLAKRMFARGYRVFRMDMRGCGAGMFRAAGVFHADRHADLLLATEHIAELCPRSKISICGFSLGANLTLKMLGAKSSRLPAGLDSAFVVEPPVDLGYCCRMLSRGLGRGYDLWFARMLWRDFSLRRSRLRRADQVTIQRCPFSLFAFDTHVTTHLGGYDSVEQYYESASSGSDLHAIQIPTVILMAADDPIVPVSVLEGFAASACVQPFVVEGGGHLGFYAKPGLDPDSRWMDWRLIHWLDEIDEACDQVLGRPSAVLR